MCLRWSVRVRLAPLSESDRRTPAPPQYAHEMWIFPFAREVLRYERMLKQESEMVTPHIWHPTYSIKYVCRETGKAISRLCKCIFCCVGTSYPVAPSGEDAPSGPPSPLDRTLSSLSGGHLSSLNHVVKPRYDHTRRRQFLLNRTGETALRVGVRDWR